MQQIRIIVLSIETLKWVKFSWYEHVQSNRLNIRILTLTQNYTKV